MTNELTEAEEWAHLCEDGTQLDDAALNRARLIVLRGVAELTKEEALVGLASTISQILVQAECSQLNRLQLKVYCHTMIDKFFERMTLTVQREVQ